MNTNELESLIRTILTEQLMPATASASNAIFASVDDAINAAHRAFLRYQQSPMKTRSAIISAIREQLKPQLLSLSERGASETGMGNKEDKFLKIKLRWKTPRD